MSQQLRSEGLLCRTQLRENAEQYSGRPQSGGSRKGFDWRALLRTRWRRDDKESIICYFLFMALFVSDFSGLALVFPVVLYCYALLAQPPARTFWQVIILFSDCPFQPENTRICRHHVPGIPTMSSCDSSCQHLRYNGSMQDPCMNAQILQIVGHNVRST